VCPYGSEARVRESHLASIARVVEPTIETKGDGGATGIPSISSDGACGTRPRIRPQMESAVFAYVTRRQSKPASDRRLSSVVAS
jgi:hypothetical protein